jgi:RNA polymerase sigma-70 factor (ECF subfamily)
MTWPPDTPFAVMLERARALDQAAVSALYKRFLPVVYRYVLARVDEIHSAEDLTAETFFAMVEGLTATRAADELGFAAWLLGIARHQVAMHYRRVRARPVVTGAPPHDDRLASGGEGDPLDIIVARESWQEVVAAVQHLTEDQRTVVLYRCVLGFSTDEVAALMGKQAGTVRALQFRALHSLAQLLGVDGAPVAHLQAPARRSGHGSRV